MVGLMEHLEKVEEEHSLLKLVEEHEKETIRRLGKEFIERREAYQEKQPCQRRNQKRAGRKMGKN